MHHRANTSSEACAQNFKRPLKVSWGAVQVEVLSEGDFVNDLHVVVSGTVLAFKYGSMTSMDDEEMTTAATMENQLMSKRTIGPGEPFGEVAFFTEISQPEVRPPHFPFLMEPTEQSMHLDSEVLNHAGHQLWGSE